MSTVAHASELNLAEDEIKALTTFLWAPWIPASRSSTVRARGQRRDAQEGGGWCGAYNCAGCHQIMAGDVTSFMRMPRYQDPDWKEQMPPQLFTEGARVQPDWLIRFLTNPALSETDIHRNGVRQYLQARMPTFHFTERQVSKLMRFFMARSSHPLPYIPEQLAPLTANEMTLARQLFNSRGAPCLKCHDTGEPAHDRTATAPNSCCRASAETDWTYRRMLEPAQIAPGTAMPSELFQHPGRPDGYSTVPCPRVSRTTRKTMRDCWCAI